MNKRKDIIPNRLKEYRKQHGYKQREVAKMLGFNSFERISYWEKGESIPNLLNLFKLSLIYRATPMQLYSELLDRIEQDIEEINLSKF